MCSERPRLAPWARPKPDSGEAEACWPAKPPEEPRLARFPRVGGKPEPEPEPERQSTPASEPGAGEGPQEAPAPELPNRAELEEEARKKGYEAGYEAGYTSGHQEGWAKAEVFGKEAFGDVAQAVRALQELGEQLEARCARGVVGLACRIAGRIVGYEVAREPEGLVRALEEAVGQLRGGVQVTVKVHPDDAPEVEAAAAEAVGRGGLARVEVVADRTMTRGGWLLDSRSGGVDGTVETRLADIEARLASLDVHWSGEPGPEGEEP